MLIADLMLRARSSLEICRPNQLRSVFVFSLLVWDCVHFWCSHYWFSSSIVMHCENLKFAQIGVGETNPKCHFFTARHSSQVGEHPLEILEHVQHPYLDASEQEDGVRNETLRVRPRRSASATFHDRYFRIKVDNTAEPSGPTRARKWPEGWWGCQEPRAAESGVSWASSGRWKWWIQEKF